MQWDCGLVGIIGNASRFLVRLTLGFAEPTFDSSLDLVAKGSCSAIRTTEYVWALRFGFSRFPYKD